MSRPTFTKRGDGPPSSYTVSCAAPRVFSKRLREDGEGDRGDAGPDRSAHDAPPRKFMKTTPDGPVGTRGDGPLPRVFERKATTAAGNNRAGAEPPRADGEAPRQFTKHGGAAADESTTPPTNAPAPGAGPRVFEKAGRTGEARQDDPPPARKAFSKTPAAASPPPRESDHAAPRRVFTKAGGGGAAAGEALRASPPRAADERATAPVATTAAAPVEALAGLQDQIARLNQETARLLEQQRALQAGMVRGGGENAGERSPAKRRRRDEWDDSRVRRSRREDHDRDRERERRRRRRDERDRRGSRRERGDLRRRRRRDRSPSVSTDGSSGDDASDYDPDRRRPPVREDFSDDLSRGDEDHMPVDASMSEVGSRGGADDADADALDFDSDFDNGDAADSAAPAFAVPLSEYVQQEIGGRRRGAVGGVGATRKIFLRGGETVEVAGAGSPPPPAATGVQTTASGKVFVKAGGGAGAGSVSPVPRSILRGEADSPVPCHMRDVIVGTCTDLEKEYHRGEGNVQAANVRPLEVLHKSFTHVKNEETAGAEYPWVRNQLKAIRQDLVVQGITTTFTWNVYEYAMRLALRTHDLDEFMKCLAQLKGMEAELERALPESVCMEVRAYRLLFYCFRENIQQVQDEVARLPAKARRHGCIRHALATVEAYAGCNYWRLTDLKARAPNLGGFIITQFMDGLREAAYVRAVKSYRNLPTVALRRLLYYDPRGADDTQLRAFLRARRAVKSPTVKGALDCAASLASIEALQRENFNPQFADLQRQ